MIGLFWEVGEVITQTKVFKMRLACLLILIAVTGCSESPRTTFDLGVAKNPVTVDGKQSFTSLIRPESPTGASAGGPSTYTVEGEKSLDDILSVTAKSGPIAYGVPHTVGLLNGKPIILVVKPVGSLR